MSTQCMQKFLHRWSLGKFICVGLDPHWDRIPKAVEGQSPHERLVNFCNEIVAACGNEVAAFKPNIAFFMDMWVEEGIAALRDICRFIRETHPDVPIILDYKRGDIGSTNVPSVNLAMSELEVDAVTINPYLGQTACDPWLRERDLLVFVVCKTSNKGAEEFQDRRVVLEESELRDMYKQPTEEFLYFIQGVPTLKFHQLIAHRVAHLWNENGNCALVMGATHTRSIAVVRQIVGPEFPLLVPGIGEQGGNLSEAVRASIGAGGLWSIPSASRSVIHQSEDENFAQRAREEVTRLNEQICGEIEGALTRKH